VRSAADATFRGGEVMDLRGARLEIVWKFSQNCSTRPAVVEISGLGWRSIACLLTNNRVRRNLAGHSRSVTLWLK